jgi:transposase
LSEVEIVARIERRRKWTAEEKAALLAEVDAAGGKVKPVARRHRISESVLYNWRSARRAAVDAIGAQDAVAFVPIGVVGGSGGKGVPMLAPPEPEQLQQPSSVNRDLGGRIEIALPSGAHIWADSSVSERVLSQVLRALKGAV